MAWWETRIGQTSTQDNTYNNNTWWSRRYDPNLSTSPQAAAPIQQVQIPQAPTPQKQPNLLQRIGTGISNALNVEKPGSLANRFWSGAGGNALVGVQKNVVQPVADQLNPEIEGSLSQKFWMGRGGDFLVATQKAGETYKPVQVVDLQSKVEGKGAKFVVSIPETMANSAYNLVTGRSIADAGFTTGEDIRTGAILDPKVYFSDLGKVAGTVLDAYVIGGLIQGFGKAITKNVAKVFGKPTLTKIAEVTARNPGFWRVATKAGLQGGKFGLAYGLFGGLEAGRDTEDNKEYLTNLALTTVGSGIMGFGVGFSLGGINYGIDKAMNHLFVSKTGTFTMKGTPDEVEMRVKEGGFENTQLGQDMLAAARYARQNGTDVGFQAYTLKQSPGGKIIGEDRVAKLFNVKNPAFEMSAVDQGGIYNFNSMPGTTNQNGMVYRFVEVPKDAANFTGDVRPIDPLLLTAPQTPANTTTGIVPSTPQAPITPEAPITTSVTPVVPAATKGITEAVVAPKTEVASVAPIEPTTPVVNEAPVAPKNEAEVKDLVTDDLKSEIPNYKSAEDFATGMINAYHGGKSEIETFDLAKAGSATDSGMWGTGFYLTNQSSIALGYANKGDTPGFVMDVFLDLKNPYIVRNANDVPTPEDLGLKKFEDMTIEEMDKASTKEYSDKLREYFISKGYDGVVANIGGGEYEEYVAFYPEQIKTRKQLENMWREGNKVASAKMTTKPVADLQVGESTVVPVDSADYRALAALDKNAYKVEAKDKFSKIVTKTAEPKVEPSVVKADTNKVENYLKDTYGKSIEKATKKELLEALKETDSEIPYTPDIAKKFGTQSAAISMSDLELRPALLYGFANKHQFTDGYIAVVNPEAADKINDKNFEKIEKSKIKDYTKRGVTYSVAEEAAKKEIQEQKDLTESKAPKLESVVPKDLSEFSDLKPTVLNPDGVVILKGDGVVTAADADKYQFVANNLPGTVVQGKDNKTSITFVSDGKVQGLVMPMNIDGIEKYADAPVVETPVQEPLPKKITIGAKKTAKPVKKKVTIGAKKPKVGSAPLSTVAKNLLKNNPGITEADAEAMAKDIVANRKVATKKAVKDGDTGGYANREAELKKMYGESFSKIKSIEMPELVQLAKELTGRTPTVTKKGLSAALGKAHTGFLLDITLRPDIFKTDFGGSFYDKEGMPEDQVVDITPKEQRIARLVLAHEIGHITDAIPDGDLKRGNELGRIGTLREFLRGTFSDPETEAKIDKLITELKDNQAKRRALRDPVLDENGEPVIVNKRVKYEITDKEADKKLLTEVKRINKEIEKLQENSIKNADIRKELKEWTQYWKPFDENAVSEGFRSYRYSSAEMYADALSGLLNDPVTLKEKAPKFWDGFFKFLDRKPKVEEAYNRIQDLINEKGDALYKRRDELINKAYNDAEAKFTAKELEKAQRKTRIWMDVKMLLDSKNALVNAKVDQAVKEGKNILDANNPKYLLEELQYIDSYVKNQIEDLFQPVKDKAEQVPDGWVQLGKILQLNRAITERGDMANPGGYDAKTATDQLKYLERTMPEKDWKVLKEAQDDFRKAQQAIVAIAKENGFWNDETIASMEANPDYATFQVIDYLDTYITPSVKRQQGTLKDIANPATSSVIKAINVLRAIERNTAKRETIDFLTKNFGDELEKAPTKWNGKFHEVVTKNKPGFEMVKIVRNGKLEGYYVDPYIAKSLNTANDVTIKALSGIMRTISGASFYRPLFTSINLGFQTFNFSKDFIRYWKNLPDATLGEAIKSFPKAVGFYKKAIKPSWDSATGKRNALIKEMENMKVLGLTYNDIYKNFDPEDAQIERTLQKIGLGETKNNKKGLAKAVTNFFNGIQTVGDFIERLPKVAGYMQLKDQMSEKQLAHFVRTRLGSPNFREGGTLTPVTNSMFLFSNAIKEGVKTDFGAATDPKTKSGYWWKTFMANVLPKLLMAMAAYGIFGKKVKELMGKASEYDKTNYTVIPLGEDENGKAIYARLPQDESGRLVSAIIWKFLNSGNRGDLKFSDLAEVFSVFGGNIPSLAPNFTALGAIGQYLSGKNPYDAFRGRNIISDDAFAAGVKYSLPELVNWLIQNNGGGIIIPNYTPGDTDMTTLQKVLSVPGLSNILGRWIKVSDYGQTEQLREISNEVKSEAAVKRIEKNKSIEEAYNEYKKSDRSDESYKEIATKLVEDVIGKPIGEMKGDEATEANAILKSLNRTIIRGRADPEVNALLFARSNAEKAELLIPILAGMRQKEAADFIQQMIDEKIITTDVLSKYSELQK